jgi:hypothetical protein
MHTFNSKKAVFDSNGPDLTEQNNHIPILPCINKKTLSKL